MKHSGYTRRSSLIFFLSIVVFGVSLIAGVSSAQARYAAIVMDADNGRVLYAVNPDTRNYPASLTKMMTLYMLFEALERGRLTLSRKLSVSRRAAGISPTKLGLKKGETIAVEVSALKGEGIDDLLENLIVVAEIGELKADPDRDAAPQHRRRECR